MKQVFSNIILPLVIVAFAIVFAFVMVGCTDAGIAKIRGYADPHRVTCYSGGKVVFDACSTGKVKSSRESDGYYFKEATTGMLVEISGNCAIIMKEECPTKTILRPEEETP